MVASHTSGFLRTTVICYALLTFAAMACAGTYSGGSGTAADPYRISTVADWQELIATSADLYRSFILVNDIDFGGMNLSPVAPDTNGNYGFQGAPFDGVFEGNGHILRNAVINLPDSDYVGLFGYIGANGKIRNLGVDTISINGRQYVGGLAGYLYSGTITASYATGSVVGSSWSVGGLVGLNEYGEITASYATGSVAGIRVGGLVGTDYGAINRCYSTGSVSGAEAGGLVGAVASNGSVASISCFWDLQTSAQAGSVGGSKGLTTQQMKTLAIFQNAGWAGYGWVMDNGLDYPRLAWQNTPGVPIPAANPIPLGGSGTAIDPYLISTPEDFVLLSWYSAILDKHFRLTSDIDLTGVALYPIGDLGGFTGVFDGAGHVLRNAVINQPGMDHVGLFGTLAFGGQVRNLVVENAAIWGRNFVGGLVGYHSYGSISNCHSTGSVTATGREIGGLVGKNYSPNPVAVSSFKGSVVGGSYVGGLVGNHEADGGSITQCFSTGTVTGSGDSIGGLAGLNWGSISNCYSQAAVKNTSYYGYYIGGLVGTNEREGRISNCYSTGSVWGYNCAGGLVGINEVWNIHRGIILSCFWDTQTSGWSNCVLCGSLSGVVCNGKSTALMKTLATFLSAGWDFVGETANGTADIWRMCGDGIDYPRLSWEFSTGGDFSCPDGVSLDDLLYLAGRWMAGTPETAGAADVDGNGKVDLSDFEVLASSWMRV